MEVIVGLGGNLGAVRQAFLRAREMLEHHPSCELRRVASVYRSRALGPSQPDYLNSALLLRVDCDLRKLLTFCHKIEAGAGRDREKEERWGPRNLDLDLLIAEGMLCRGPLLELPHPRLDQRAFALYPAIELAPEWIHPLCARSLKELTSSESLKQQFVERVESPEWALRG